MLWHASSINDILTILLMRLPIAAFSLGTHEFAHAYAAYKLGDPTAKNLGRVTLNPLVHLDFIGTLAMLFAPIGWPKPTPLNPANFRNRKRDSALVAAAGPLSNFLLSLTALIIIKILFHFPQTPEIVCQFFEVFAFMNLGLCLFNLIPIPPFDGGEIFMPYFPVGFRKLFSENGKYSLLVLIVIIYFISDFISMAVYFLLGKMIFLLNFLPF